MGTRQSCTSACIVIACCACVQVSVEADLERTVLTSTTSSLSIDEAGLELQGGPTAGRCVLVKELVLGASRSVALVAHCVWSTTQAGNEDDAGRRSNERVCVVCASSVGG